MLDGRVPAQRGSPNATFADAAVQLIKTVARSANGRQSGHQSLEVHGLHDLPQGLARLAQQAVCSYRYVLEIYLGGIGAAPAGHRLRRPRNPLGMGVDDGDAAALQHRSVRLRTSTHKRDNEIGPRPVDDVVLLARYLIAAAVIPDRRRVNVPQV